MQLAFDYHNGQYCLVHDRKYYPLSAWANPHAGPVFVYNGNYILERLEQIASVLPPRTTLHYAVKANNNANILRMLKQKTNIGVDVVSSGELTHALACGFRPEQVVFSGAGKSKAELEYAIKIGPRLINVESLSELKRIGDMAKSQNKVVALALRLNPDVEVATHPYIQTGARENKFGIDIAQLAEALTLIKGQGVSLQLKGLAMHIGSQMMSAEGFVQASKRIIEVFRELKSQGFALSVLDVGGGWGVDYLSSGDKDTQLIESFGKELKALAPQVDADIILEPGRILVARAGVLLTQIEYIKKTPYKNFLIVDSGIHHFVRPALYQAYHRILPLREQSEDQNSEVYDVVGPLCESSDVLGRERALQGLQEGDFLVVCDTGAYGSSMSSNYNLRGLAREILVLDGNVKEYL